MLRVISRFGTLASAFWAAAALAGCATQHAPMQKPAGLLANPASENCIRQGGSLDIRKRGDGGEYGVCKFADHRECEEWAMLRGACPVGGVEIAGYVTPAAQHCAITGGRYLVTADSDTDREQGTCFFPTGQCCDAGDYFTGKCAPGKAEGESTYDDPFAYCAAAGTIDTPDGRYTGEKLPNAVIRGMVRQGIVAADAPTEFQRHAVWRCMHGKLWVCHFGANLPCLEKADTARASTAATDEYCRANPSVDAIPAAVTGRATVYAWGCRDGKPQVIRQLFRSDPRGYLADFWHELAE